MKRAYQEENSIEELMFADDLVMMAEDQIRLQEMVSDLDQQCKKYGMRIWRDKTEVMVTSREPLQCDIELDGEMLEDRGLKSNRKKTVYLRFNVDRDLDDGNSDVNIQGENLERLNTFKYLGATLAENGDLDAEMTHRIQSGWKNWKRISGILCDRRISLRVKGKYTRQL